jgi:hypothetical protein
VKDYVEYEDVVKFANFFISNCGAGSVLVPLVAGVPQTCDWIDEVQGQDIGFEIHQFCSPCWSGKIR